jgi:hypothetical protein
MQEIVRKTTATDDASTLRGWEAIADQIRDCGALIDDQRLANILSMAPATIRVQRHLRRQKRHHWLTIDPIYVGTRPRYLPDSVADFLRSLVRRDRRTNNSDRSETLQQS